MTVIAWDGKTLACDSRITVGSRLAGTQKIWRIRGRLFGSAGDAVSTETAKAWLARGGSLNDRPKLHDNADFEGVLIERDGRVFHLDERLIPVPIEGGAWALGSGSDFAIALMAVGMTAESAVLTIIEKELAEGVGGKVQTLTLRRSRRLNR